MYYDPIKNVFASITSKCPSLRIVFYKILNIMFLRSWYVRRELRNIRSVSGDKKLSIYDAGTGYGQYSYFMAKKLKPCSIYAVDVKGKWIEDCKFFFRKQKLDNVKFGIEDLTSINHENEFDLILSVDVMEHIENDLKVFENFYKALKPDGFLLINTPSIYGGSDVHEKGNESFISEHARDGYSFKELGEKLSPRGFTPFRARYTYGFWGDKAWRLGIKYPMQLLNISKLFLIVLPFYYVITILFTFVMMFIDFHSNNKIGAGVNYIVRK